jgi:hypothetical protein
MEGIRNEVLGAPGGRTRYPITIRKIKLETAIAERAMIKTGGFIGYREQANQIGKGYQDFFGSQSKIGSVRV